MIERTADQWIRWYYNIRDSHGPVGMDIVEQRGYYWAETCYECGSRREKAMREDEGNKYCGNCGKKIAWAYELAFTLRGQIQRAPDNHIGENRLANQVSVGYAIEQLLSDRHIHWKVKTYICKVMSGMTNSDLGIEMAGQFPAFPFAGSEDTIRYHVKQGRKLMSRRLKRLGLGTL